MFVRYTIILLMAAAAAVHLSVAANPPSSDETLLSGSRGLNAYVSKKGAKIRVYRNVSTGHGFGDSGTFEVFLDTIEELDANLDKLKGNHKTSSFSNVDFTVTQPRNVSLPLAESSSVYADCINTTATLTKVGEGAQISLGVCAIVGNATLNMNGELTNVTDGQLKITFTIINWPWYAVNDKLAVDIVIKIPPGRTVSDNSSESESHRKPTKFSFGDDAMIEFSRMVYVDNAWTTMPSGYPKYTSQGANNHFTLILNHFNKSAIYDPNLDVGSQLSDSENFGQRTVQQLSIVCLIAVLFVSKLIV
jgi:hypothetical protein